MKKQNKIYLGIGVVAIILIAAIMMNLNQETTNDKTIKIGVITPLTGSSQEHGQNIKNGIDLAHETINNSNIEIIYQDSKCGAKEAVNAYKTLKIKDVRAIIGTVCSGATLAIAPLAQEDKTPLIASAASNPSISNAGEFIYRVYPSDELDSKVIARFVANDRIGIVRINNDYGKGVYTAFKNNFNGSIVLDKKFEYGETDFRTILTKMKSKNLDKIVFIGYPDNTLEFLRQSKEFGISIPIVGSTATFTSKLFNESYDNFYFTSPDISPNGRSDYVQRYTSKYGKNPEFPSEYGHDALLILEEALKERGELDLKSQLDKAFFPKGATGNISFDEQGDREGVKIKGYKINNSTLKCTFNCE